jgi:hypothetical protein
MSCPSCRTISASRASAISVRGEPRQRLVPLLAGEVNEGTYMHALPSDLAVARDALAGMFKIGEGA